MPLQVLLEKGVTEGKILFLSLIAAPDGIHKICGTFPRVKVITSEIDAGIGDQFQVIPGAAAPRASLFPVIHTLSCQSLSPAC